MEPENMGTCRPWRWAMTDVTHAPADRRTPTGEALVEMAEAWRAVEAARAHAYEYHQHAGLGDAHLVRAVGLLRKDGHHDIADAICRHLLGHGVAEDRWTLQVQETQDDAFARTLMTLEEQVRERTR
jgi:hypothetical protein